MSKLCLPGIIDAHVHLREPGATHKEDILTGTTAALAGGVIAVLDMPNNSPPTVDARTLDQKRHLFAQKAVSDYGLFLGYAGGDLESLMRLGSQVVGLKLYLDETFGQMQLDRNAQLASVFQAWPGPGPIAVHADSHSIPGVLELAARYGQHLHICHTPHPDDLLLIADARSTGVHVTCEVTPHHLILTQHAVKRLGAYAQMKPPLLPPNRVAQFWERLELIDMVASDHAPHTRNEKQSTNPPPGVPGLETTLPLFLALIERGRLSLERFLQLAYYNPLRIYGLKPPRDSQVIVDLSDGFYRLPFDGYHTRCGWSPFAGQEALGHIVSVRLRAQLVWERGKRLVSPGYGRPLARQAAEI